MKKRLSSLERHGEETTPITEFMTHRDSPRKKLIIENDGSNALKNPISATTMPIASFNEESSRGYPAPRDREQQEATGATSALRLVVMNDKRLNFYRVNDKERVSP